jgi:hypothetical protein
VKAAIKSFGMIVFSTVIFLGSCAKKPAVVFSSFKNPEVAAKLKSFVAEKESQAEVAAKAEGKSIAPPLLPFFSAAEKGDWLTMSNMFPSLQTRTGQVASQDKHDLMDLRGTQWEAVKEIWGAFDEINEGDEKYAVAFGNDIIESIPPGSIYFGGTDSGRFIVTALQKSHVAGDPFFTLTQNALADGSYLDYLRSMYGDRIYIATPEDSQKCFQSYTEAVTRRQQNHQLKPGEDVRVEKGRVQISGHVAVMGINGLLVKTIYDKNPSREFYIEESFPLDWMYPNLEPHGLIMKINRQPLTDLSDEVVRNDSDYWLKYMTPMIGGWLNPATTIQEVAAFAEKIQVKKDLSGFTGDPRFVQNEDSCRMFSKLRSSIGGLYAWRAQHAADAGEKKRMNDAADLAFLQAWALCPYSPEVIFRYVNLLLSENRGADALLVAETAGKIPSMQGRDGDQLRLLINDLERYQKGDPGIQIITSGTR